MPVKHVNVMFFLYILFCVSLNITICFVNGITLHTNDAYWLLLFVQSTTNELFELCDICDCEFECSVRDGDSALTSTIDVLPDDINSPSLTLCVFE